MDEAPLHVGGGATTVGSEPMLVMVEALHQQAARCRSAAGALASLDDGRGHRPTVDSVREAALEARAVAERLSFLASGLGGALDLYAGVESTTRAGIEVAASSLASLLGAVGARLGVVLAPGLLSGAASAAAVVSLLPAPAQEALRGVGDHVLAEAARTLSGPGSVEMLRWLVTLTDDTAVGVLGAPPMVAPLIGETGAGWTGVPAAASTILGLAVLARIHGTIPTTVRTAIPAERRRETVPVRAPSGAAERVARIPDSSGPQVVVERYPSDSGDRFEVYIGGTDPAAIPGGENPWDMASNVALIAEQDASSQQAVAQALTDAGATTESSVVFTGYSQGAAIAVRLAESGFVDTAGLITVGGPTGNLPVTGDYPALVIEHRDDAVTALSGVRRETTATVITTTAFPNGAESPVAAHDHDLYLRTAGRVDDSELGSISGLLGRLPGDDAVGDALPYRATRIRSGE